MNKYNYQWNYKKNSVYDSIFFIFPFWFSVLYFFLIKLFGEYDNLIFLISYILLAETHFASTWTSYLNSSNILYFKKRKIIFYYIPLIIILFVLIISFFISLELALFIGSIFSAVHVTRQSTGIIALYRRNKSKYYSKQRIYNNISIYLGSATFLMIGFKRFYLELERVERLFIFNLLNENTILFLIKLINVSSVVSFIGIWIFYILSILSEFNPYEKKSKISLPKLIVLSYSIFLYSPYLFVDKIVHAVGMGVGIHYIQYLGLVWLLNKRKYISKNHSKGLGDYILVFISQNYKIRFLYLMTYALLSFVAFQGGIRFDKLKPDTIFYSIPLSLQFVHYYIDAFLWKFSNPFIRESVLKYLK